MVYLIISNILTGILLILFIISYFNLLKDKKDLYFNIEKEKIDNDLSIYTSEALKRLQDTLDSYNLLLKKIQTEIEIKENKLKEKQKEYDNLNKYFSDLEKQGKEQVEKRIEEYSEYKNREIEKNSELREEDLIKTYLVKRKNYELQKEEYAQSLSEELEEIKNEINEYKEKRQTINEEILRQRELIEKETFYSINLTEQEIQDIIYLEGFENKISNKEVLAKAIYEAYYKKPLTEMVKRITKNEEFSGIYKITYKPTGEIYIGRAVNIQKRWIDHVKSSLGIGTLVSSTLHRNMKKYGCWQFTFEVLERVQKDELAKRESYWINFYESNIYGMNMRKESADE